MTFLDKNGLDHLWSYMVALLGDKVDKVNGKGLSSCDFTVEEKEKLSSLSPNVIPDWTETDESSYSYIKNKPVDINGLYIGWDGNTQGLPNVENIIFKVSDKIPSIESLEGAEVTAYSDGNITTSILSTSNFEEIVSGFVFNGGIGIVYDDIDFNGLMISSGTYFYNQEGVVYVRSLSTLKQQFKSEFLPIATAETLGAVQPTTKTDDMTQPVGIDENGKLWTVVGSGSGEGGTDGYTPVRGVDYWTEEDQIQIVSDVLAALPNASGVNF